MGSVNISLKDEAYKFLKSVKSKDQSFSEVILQFKKRSGGVLRYFGVLRTVNWNDHEAEMKKLRDSFEERL